MDRFIFHTQLETQLQYLIDNPEKLGGTVAFHGSFGIGKTSFAKYLGNLLAKEVIHYDCAKAKSLVLEDMETRNRTTSLASLWDTEDQTEKVFERCYILDEFNSLFPKRNKDAFKIPLENLAADNRCLVIIIANTDARMPLTKALTPAIASRCYSINFDLNKSQYHEVSQIIKARYPVLTDDYIRATLPDLRQICKRAKLLLT